MGYDKMKKNNKNIFDVSMNPQPDLPRTCGGVVAVEAVCRLFM